MTADVKLIAGPIPEGSILVLTGFSFRKPWTDAENADAAGVALDPLDDVAQQLWSELRRAVADVVGHERFLLLHLPDDGADVEVWGPDTDLEAKVEELLAGRGMQPRPELKPDLRYLTFEGRSVLDDALRRDIPRRHCVRSAETEVTLCRLPTLGLNFVEGEPFTSWGGVGIVCSACADRLKELLARHHHDEKVDPPCGWCHTCGTYLGDSTGACPGCGAVDVEG